MMISTGLWDVISSFSQPTSDLWFQDITRLGDPNITCYFATICYFIWFHKNKKIFDNSLMDPKRIISATSTFLLDFQQASTWPERPSASLMKQNWEPPPRRGSRIFFDGGISLRFSCVGCGVFVTDEKNSFVFGLSKKFDGIHNPEIAEFLALRGCFNVIHQLKLNNVSILGDAENVLLSAKGDSRRSSICQPILDDILLLMSTTPIKGLHWINRADNIVAHEFAFFAKNSTSCINSWIVPPDFLLSFRAGCFPAP
ncbi:hypothetical protein OROHE_015489 [Orobanche hederae]